MAEALGLVEYWTIAAGFRAADTIAKTAEVRLLRAQIICPGKYTLLFSGEISAVKAVLDAAKERHADKLVDSFLLGSPHTQVIDALNGVKPIDVRGSALGVVEVATVAAAVVAADMAAKAAGVQIIELRLEREVANKAYVLMRGTVSEVTEAVDQAAKRAYDDGMLLDSAVLPKPDVKFWESLGRC